jgi:hypothetical protein
VGGVPSPLGPPSGHVRNTLRIQSVCP